MSSVLRPFDPIVERKIRGLRASIYHHTEFTDCSNGGISSRVKTVTVIGPDITRAGGEIFEPTNDAPAVILVRRALHVYNNVGQRTGETREYVHAEPFDCGTDRRRPAMGGAFIHTSDSRFNAATGIDYPIALHDRFEG